MKTKNENQNATFATATFATFPDLVDNTPYNSPSSIPYWQQIHLTATGGNSCCWGVMPH
jgi:hypothetical protein